MCKTDTSKVMAEFKIDEKFGKDYEKSRTRYKVALEIIKARYELGISQEELALRVNTNKSVISRIEWGKSNLSIDFLATIAHSMGKKINIVFGELKNEDNNFNPNKETIEAMLEAEHIVLDRNTKGYTDIDKLFEELESDSWKEE